MAIEESVISKLEKLSKLKLTEAERIEMKGDLEKMINMVDKLSEVNTDGVEPLVYMHNEKNVLRKDKVDSLLDRESGLENAPKRVGNYFAVPKIIQK